MRIDAPLGANVPSHAPAVSIRFLPRRHAGNVDDQQAELIANFKPPATAVIPDLRLEAVPVEAHEALVRLHFDTSRLKLSTAAARSSPSVSADDGWFSTAATTAGQQSGQI